MKRIIFIFCIASISLVHAETYQAIDASTVVQTATKTLTVDQLNNLKNSYQGQLNKKVTDLNSFKADAAVQIEVYQSQVTIDTMTLQALIDEINKALATPGLSK